MQVDINARKIWFAYLAASLFPPMLSQADERKQYRIATRYKYMSFIILNKSEYD